MMLRLLDEQYLKTPFYGSRKITKYLIEQGYEVNRKRVIRLMRKLGLQAVYPKKRTTIPNQSHKIYPYLLRDLAVQPHSRSARPLNLIKSGVQT